MADKKDNQNVRKNVSEMSFMSDKRLLEFGPRSLVEQDRGFLTGFLQIEKVVAAIFLVFGQDIDDMLRGDIRKTSLNVLHESVNLLIDTTRGTGQSFARLRAQGFQLLSLLKIAEAAGAVSEMNAKLLREAISTSLTGIAERLSRTISTESLRADGASELEQFPTVAIKDISLKDMTTPEPQKSVRRSGPTARGGSSREARTSRHTDREAAIARLVAERGEVSVKDVAAVIGGVSEKTLQRELLSMVAKGLLKKEGERRWSRYSLAGTPA